MIQENKKYFGMKKILIAFITIFHKYGTPFSEEEITVIKSLTGKN